MLTKFLLSIFLIMSSFAYSMDTPYEYTIMDLGTIEADESDAIAINDKGQVLGTFKDIGNEYIFLWDIEHGIQIVDIPQFFVNGRLFLNNKGQIAGSRDGRAFIWDSEVGLFEIEQDSCLSIVAFNDNWQIIGHKYTNGQSHSFLWERGRVTNLTSSFKEKVKGDWLHVEARAIDNFGNVVITAHDDSLSNRPSRSFLWKDGIFKSILPDEPYVLVNAIDDNGNFLVSLDKFYFINPAENFKAYIFDDHNIVLRNNRPIQKYSLLGNLKLDADGEQYFGSGINIRKLLVADSGLYYNLSGRTTVIRDQNSKGIVVGQIDTLYGNHAFIAFPKSSH
jgi:hypothetical protein